MTPFRSGHGVAGSPSGVQRLVEKDPSKGDPLERDSSMGTINRPIDLDLEKLRSYQQDSKGLANETVTTPFSRLDGKLERFSSQAEFPLNGA
jgi:hypothetical protein